MFLQAGISPTPPPPLLTLLCATQQNPADPTRKPVGISVKQPCHGVSEFLGIACVGSVHPAASFFSSPISRFSVSWAGPPQCPAHTPSHPHTPEEPR